jgi:hypothetical protein
MIKAYGLAPTPALRWAFAPKDNTKARKERRDDESSDNGVMAQLRGEPVAGNRGETWHRGWIQRAIHSERVQIQVTIGEEVVPIHNRRSQFTITRLHCLITDFNFNLPICVLGTNDLTKKKIGLYIRFKVITALTMKKVVFWDATPCGSCKNRRFGGT